MDDKFEQWKEQLQRTHGPRAYFSKKMLAKQWLAFNRLVGRPLPPSSPSNAQLTKAVAAHIEMTALSEGPPKAKVLFIGEMTGPQVDPQNKPFEGDVGELLHKIIGAMHLGPQNVHILNVIKHDETVSSESLILQKIDDIAPQAIVILGATSLNIPKVRGPFLEFRGAQLISTYHPSYLLQNPAAKKEVWEDMKKVMALLA